MKKPNALDKNELKIMDIDLDYDETDNENERKTEINQSRDDKLKIQLMKYYINQLKEEKADRTDLTLFELLDKNMKEIVLENILEKQSKKA